MRSKSLTVTIKGAAPIEVGSDGELGASDVEAALKGRDKEPKDVHASRFRSDRRPLRRNGHGPPKRRHLCAALRWEGGGLFGGRSLRLVGLSR